MKAPREVVILQCGHNRWTGVRDAADTFRITDGSHDGWTLVSVRTGTLIVKGGRGEAAVLELRSTDNAQRCEVYANYYPQAEATQPSKSLCTDWFHPVPAVAA